jgi:hypothetical protein
MGAEGVGGDKQVTCPLADGTVIEKSKFEKKKEMYQILIRDIKIVVLKLFFYPEYSRATSRNIFRNLKRKFANIFCSSPLFSEINK